MMLTSTLVAKLNREYKCSTVCTGMYRRIKLLAQSSSANCQLFETEFDHRITRNKFLFFVVC